MQFTRTVKTYKATAYKMTIEDGAPVIAELGSVEFHGTAPTKTVVRKAFSDAGHPVPKGCEINIVPVKEVTYGMTLEDFLKYAKVINIAD